MAYLKSNEIGFDLFQIVFVIGYGLYLYDSQIGHGL